MNRCIHCGKPSQETSGLIYGLCLDCHNLLWNKNPKIDITQTQYRTYENGYADGYRAGQISYQAIFDKAVEMISKTQVKYLVVTQEKFDELMKLAQPAEKE